MTIKEQVNDTIEELKQSGIWGCITGSCMIDGDFDAWASVPDVDVFVYCEEQLVHATTWLEAHGYKPANGAEEWKLGKLREGQKQRKASFIVRTHKMKKDDIIVNVTYKPGCDTIDRVLSTFDMSIIMVGYDIKLKQGLDYRTGGPFTFGENADKWSTSPLVAVPNPLRSQEVDRYKVEQWVRQFDRVIKYWERGYDTRPMARFYIDAVQSVIDMGAQFSTDKAVAAYDAFVEEFGPVRDSMKAWLEDKEEC